MKKIMFCCIVALASFFLFPCAPEAMDKNIDKFLALGTASASSDYYPVGKGIAELINKNRLKHRIRCTAYSTGGGVYNVRALMSGELDLAITTIDQAYDAYKGIGEFSSLGPNKNIRLIAALYDQLTGVIVKSKSPVSSFAMLPGNRINIGNLGSGTRAISEQLCAAMQWSSKDFSKVMELSTKEMGEAFCREDVDILIETKGFPAHFFEKMARDCSGRFIDIPESVIKKIQQSNPLLENTFIPGGLYPNNPEKVSTLKLKVVLITLKRLHPESIYQVTSAIFQNMDEFRSKNNVLMSSNPDNMIIAEPVIPFHEGALKYLRERGLNKDFEN